jgi:hypothetical protein
MQFYNKRLELLIGGPESYLKAKRSLSEIKTQEIEDRYPLLKTLSDGNSHGLTHSARTSILRSHLLLFLKDFAPHNTANEIFLIGPSTPVA